VESTASIGPSIEIKGTISAQEPLVVAGRVIGSIDMPGQVLTIATSAVVDGDVAAEGILIGGRANGRLHATERITVQNTAVVEGTVSTPIMSVAIGAAVHAECVVEGRRRAVLALAS
jgi:cytoskeletal protein CcmA (bactofilin family)